MIMRLMRFLRWIGHSGTSAVIAEQFGFAMMPLWSLMRFALISGSTSGTFGSMRKADELSTTTAPAFTAIGPYFLEIDPPAENSAMSTPSNDFSVSSWMTIFSPLKSIVLPTARALASATSLPTGKLRFSSVAANSAPTAPVAPTMATVGFFFIFVHSSRQQKSPGPFGGASDQAMRFDLRARDDRSPGGLLRLRRGFRHGRHSARNLWAA